jgi:pimeloyl-ACP methyl ester carboxylesterase
MATMIPNLTVHRKEGNEVALVFIHGFTGHPELTWGHFPKFLGQDSRISDWDIFSLGYATTLALDIRGFWRGDPELASVADLLRTDAEVLLRAYKTLALIGHSMGGLAIQRALIDDARFCDRISHVFLFGTPSKGLVTASWLQFWKRSIGDMAQGSRFITDLRARWSQTIGSQPPFQFYVIAGDQDYFVPRSSSLEPFSPLQCAVVQGNHLEIVKPLDANDLSVQLVLHGLIGTAAPAGPWNAARVAVESRNFRDAIAQLEPQKDRLDPATLVELALALEGVGRRNDAILALERARGRDHTDALGVLAGRLKRRWIVERVEEDARQARALYAHGLELAEANNDHPQAFYLGINVAFMDLTYGDNRDTARTMAKKVLEHCAQARAQTSPGKWLLAIEGEAWLHLGESRRAFESYQQAVQLQPKPRELASMYQQAVVVARHVGDVAAQDWLESLFRGSLNDEEMRAFPA